MYSPKVLDHFEHPRNSGQVENASARVRVENPACGDILELSASFQSGKIADIRFRAKGCVPSIACASALTELVGGKTIQEATRLTREDLLRELGELPEASQHASYLAIDALRELLRKI
jgi:nitrogen fixation NifU-like protein